ncbi:MAG: hypothetical protein H0V17_12275 [Deltaproteobacteria bacterium]|nr:hypothetical protein [Deltaproteobacteria bacterium]
MKRRLDLSGVLEDIQPNKLPAVAVAALPLEKRVHSRFDKAFLVMIGSELYGDSSAVARNVSTGGILVEMSYAPPLGTVVTVHFQHTRADDLLDEIVVRAEVKHHHYLNFGAIGETATSTRAIGLRFLEFVDAGERVSPERLH